MANHILHNIEKFRLNCGTILNVFWSYYRNSCKYELYNIDWSISIFIVTWKPLPKRSCNSQKNCPLCKKQLKNLLISTKFFTLEQFYHFWREFDPIFHNRTDFAICSVWRYLENVRSSNLLTNWWINYIN